MFSTLRNFWPVLISLIGLVLSFSGVWIAYLLSSPKADFEYIEALISLAQLFLALAGTAVAIVGAYFAFFKPFEVEYTVGSFTWRLRPIGSPNIPFELVLRITARNKGARSGRINYIAATIDFESTRLHLTPFFFVDPKEYMVSLLSPKDSPVIPVSDAFCPIPLNNNESKLINVLLAPSEGSFDFAALKPGMYVLRIWSQVDDHDLIEIARQKIVFEQSALSDRDRGITIAGQNIESRNALEEMLPKTIQLLRVSPPSDAANK